MQRYPLKTRRKYIKPLWTIFLNDINTAAKFVRLVCFGRKVCSYAGILSLKKQALQKQREEDGGGGCICFAFRNEFVEGRIYARSCKKSGYNVPRNRESRMGYMKGGKIMKRIVVFVILYED